MGDLNITFLGTGTSIGVPVVGCDCEVCRSEDPRNQRTRASIYVQTPEVELVVDTGPDFRTQCLREQIRNVDAVVYTHEHSDHIMGFDDLRRFTVGHHETLPVYASEECLKRLRAAFGFAFDKSNWYPGYIKPEAHEINGAFELGATTLTPLEVQHGKVRTMGFLFGRAGTKSLAYVPDCKRIPEKTMQLMQGVDCLVIDCLRKGEHPTHMGFEEAMAVREQVQPKQTWLTHISDAIDHGPFEAGLPEGVRIAYDGLKLSLV